MDIAAIRGDSSLISDTGAGRFQRYVCDILTTFFIFETLQMNVISLQDV